MNKFFGSAFAIGMFAFLNVSAQNEIDILRYGQLSSGATARSLSLGGAGGSFGGDFSSLSINPAGIGVYRNSEIMITPSLRFNKVNATYLGNKDQDDQAKLGVNNFGIVFTTAAKGKQYERSAWKAISFGIGYNRLADFNSAGRYSGSNRESSITDMFSKDALSVGVDQNVVPPFGFLAYQGFLLYDNFNSIVREEILNKGGSVYQTKSWDSKGGVDEWVVSLGGNYQEKLLLGGTLGILSYKYDKSSTFREEDETGNLNNDFDYLSYYEMLSTTGYGFNLKLGGIYIVNEQFRFGASFHSPTWSSMNDITDYNLTTNTENLKYRTNQASTNPKTFVQPDYPYEYNYNIRTPWRANLSGTYFLGKSGFITADYEFVDFASMKYSFKDLDKNYENEVNKNIKNTFTSAHNIRLGVEGRKDNFMGRVGFAYHTSPFQRSADFGGESMDVSVGVGGRFGPFFMDLGYMHTFATAAEYGYPLLASGVPVGLADLKYGNNIVALTLGLKF